MRSEDFRLFDYQFSRQLQPRAHIWAWDRISMMIAWGLSPSSPGIKGGV
jgi:hypothetical protein